MSLSRKKVREKVFMCILAKWEPIWVQADSLLYELSYLPFVSLCAIQHRLPVHPFIIASIVRSQIPPQSAGSLYRREYYPYFIKKTGLYAVTSANHSRNTGREHPFLYFRWISFETIEFDHAVYHSINLAFDICRSEVVVLSPNRNGIVLPEGKAQSLPVQGTCSGAEYWRFEADFYDVLVWPTARAWLLKGIRRVTELWHTISDYYIIRNEQAYPVSLVTMKTIGEVCRAEHIGRSGRCSSCLHPAESFEIFA